MTRTDIREMAEMRHVRWSGAVTVRSRLVASNAIELMEEPLK
jgi:hypothetical protein